MFGYMKPCQPELRVKELDAYKAVYCGLCGQLGRSYGPVARLTLSYDFTFLSMLYWAVSEEKPRVEKHRCYVNPLKKLPMCRGGEALELGADLAAIMIYYKLLDNILDGGLFSKIALTPLRPLAASARNRAGRRCAGWEALVSDSMEWQRSLERKKTDCMDAACEPTAAMLSGIFGSLSANNNQQRVLGRLGYLTGRYIYLCDALDDLEQDVKKGGYNPIALRYGLSARSGPWEEARREAAASLYMTIGEAEKTLALLEMHDFVPVIENIVSMGMRTTVDGILAKKKEINR